MSNAPFVRSATSYERCSTKKQLFADWNGLRHRAFGRPARELTDFAGLRVVVEDRIELVDSVEGGLCCFVGARLIGCVQDDLEPRAHLRLLKLIAMQCRRATGHERQTEQRHEVAIDMVERSYARSRQFDRTSCYRVQAPWACPGKSHCLNANTPHSTRGVSDSFRSDRSRRVYARVFSFSVFSTAGRPIG